jgi:Holliday junction resolvase RusA-like endonuclease
VIVFFVPGLPQQQGTKTKWGTEENPHVTSWRESVARSAHEIMGDEPPLHGPVRVTVTFTFPRPKTHYRGGKFAGLLKETAPFFHTGPPDLDKLQRAIGDSLTATILRDDRQISSWGTRKIYGDKVGAQIAVEPLDTDYTQGTIA